MNICQLNLMYIWQLSTLYRFKNNSKSSFLVWLQFFQSNSFESITFFELGIWKLLQRTKFEIIDDLWVFSLTWKTKFFVSYPILNDANQWQKRRSNKNTITNKQTNNAWIRDAFQMHVRLCDDVIIELELLGLRMLSWFM